MKIKCGNYYINTDANENVWITEEVLSDKTSKTYEKRVSGYHRTIKAAVENMMVKKIFSSDCTTVEQVADTVQKLIDDALNILEGGVGEC